MNGDFTPKNSTMKILIWSVLVPVLVGAVAFIIASLVTVRKTVTGTDGTQTTSTSISFKRAA